MTVTEHSLIDVLLVPGNFQLQMAAVSANTGSRQNHRVEYQVNI